MDPLKNTDKPAAHSPVLKVPFLDQGSGLRLRADSYMLWGSTAFGASCRDLFDCYPPGDICSTAALDCSPVEVHGIKDLVQVLANASKSCHCFLSKTLRGLDCVEGLPGMSLQLLSKACLKTAA